MKLSKEQLEHFKKILEAEKIHLEGDLGVVGQKNPGVPGDWEVKDVEPNTEAREKSEEADQYEEMENKAAIEDKLEERLQNVVASLARVKKGTYGVCEKCGEAIDIKRLEANPTARFCVKHTKNGKR